MPDRLHHERLKTDNDSNRESHRLLARRERSLPALVHASLAAAPSALQPSRRGRARSSSQAALRGCTRPQIAATRLKRGARAALSDLISTRIYCGRLSCYGSSSSESTRGVGRDRGPEPFSASVILSVCLIFNVVSVSTNSLSEMLVTLNLPPITSPLYTLR